MRIVSLEQIKRNAKIEYDDRDDIIEQIGETAEAMVENMLNRTYDDLEDEYGLIPAPVFRAVLMLSEHLYNHTTPTSNAQVYSVPYTIDVMIKPYSRLGWHSQNF